MFQGTKPLVVLISVVAIVFASLGAFVALKFHERSERGAAAGKADFSMTDLVVGHGADAVPGRLVAIHYRGFLVNGTQFDSSYDRGQPYEFRLGVGQVIKGWDRGVMGMKVGGKRRVTLPPELAYGAKGAGSVVPPNSVLIYEIELENVK